VIDSRISLVLFAVLFVVVVSFASTSLSVEGIECSDPGNLISQPDANSTTVNEVTSSASGILDVFFGCSSQNPLINGFFLALQASIIIVLLMIIKDLIPLT